MIRTLFSLADVRKKQVIVCLVLTAAMLGIEASVSLAQTADPMAIRVETREVVVPVVVADKSYYRWDKCEDGGRIYIPYKEISGLSGEDFHVFEDGIAQRIQNLAVEPLHVWDVRDNFSTHVEASSTPRGIWACPDVWWQTNCVYHSSPWHMYLVSYVPPESPAGSCHQIKVQADRPHATVLARDEYCNMKYPPSDPLKGTKLGQQMDGYANSTQAGMLPMSVQVGNFFGGSSATRVDIAVEIPWSGLKRKWHGVNLEVLVAVSGLVYDKDKTLVARFSESALTASGFWVPSFPGFPYAGNNPYAQKEMETLMVPSRYETQIDLPPGDYDLKLVVTDGEKFWRAEVPLSVERPPGDSPAISGIVFCKRYHKLADGPAQGVRAPEYVPMVSNGVEFTPAGDTHFKKKEQLVSYFEIYEPLFGETEVEKVQFQMKVTDAKTGELKSDTGLRQVESWVRPGMTVVAVVRKIAINRLPPGTYRLEVQAFDSAGRTTPWRAATFTVE